MFLYNIITTNIIDIEWIIQFYNLFYDGLALSILFKIITAIFQHTLDYPYRYNAHKSYIYDHSIELA